MKSEGHIAGAGDIESTCPKAIRLYLPKAFQHCTGAANMKLVDKGDAMASCDIDVEVYQNGALICILNETSARRSENARGKRRSDMMTDMAKFELVCRVFRYWDEQ